MSTYYEYVFGVASDIYDLLAKGYGNYNKAEFLTLLNKARSQHEALQEENTRLKQEIELMNINIVASLERDLFAMRKTFDSVIKPKYTIRKTVEQLDV